MHSIILRIKDSWHARRHRRRYPALAPPSSLDVSHWWDVYHTVSDDPPSTSARETIAIIPNEAWHRLHQFCWDHDIERGHSPWHRFDVRTCIQVWTIDLLHPRRWGELLFVLWPSPLCGEGPFALGWTTPVVVDVQLILVHHGSTHFGQELAQARHFFAKLYGHAVGHPLPLDHVKGRRFTQPAR